MLPDQVKVILFQYLGARPLLFFSDRKICFALRLTFPKNLQGQDAKEQDDWKKLVQNVDFCVCLNVFWIVCAGMSMEVL